MSLTDLLPEILILILSFLPVSSLGSILRLNKKWFMFIDENQNTIYRDAAYLEGYVPDPATLLEGIGPTEAGMERRALYSRRVTDGLEGWKDLCRRRKLVEQSWAGHAPSSLLPSPRSPDPPLANVNQNTHRYRVHRIKVDEKAGIILTTSQVGGLLVRDLESDEVLWELPAWHVRAYAHLEYGQGYVIFDRQDGNKEIWRRTVDITNAPQEIEVDPCCLPDGRMHSVAGYMSTLTSTHSLTTAHRNAQFSPHALLRMPEPTRAYRHVFPTLAVASFERAFMFDVRTGARIQTLEGIQTIPPTTEHEEHEEPPVAGSSGEHEQPPPPPSQVADTVDHVIPIDSDENHTDEATDDNEEDDDVVQDLSQLLGQVRYVEVSERHVFLAGPYVLRVFSRATGKAVLDIPSTRSRYGRWRWELASRESVKDHGGRYDTYEDAQEQHREVVRLPTRFSWEQYRSAERVVIDQFIAVHVSSDGKHLVAMLSGSRLVMIPNFEDLLTKHSRMGMSGHPARTSRDEFKRDKDREIFEHTLDIQLGAPLGSSSVYLAYEHGRIGVVTSNSVFVVTPAIPNADNPIDAPKLTVSRLPYFSNPSWLCAVSCLMMSDTGLYLNWNPAVDDGEGETMQDWDARFEDELTNYERHEKHRYHMLPNGDGFVAAAPMAFDVSEVSTVFSVKFAMVPPPPPPLTNDPSSDPVGDASDISAEDEVAS
ncbi:hypothetical protein M413DRAFT_440688 [Hebeloma cylindrosporum]|uniref:F-box domain-containing protein n=1 Tax=Hebeloma cylindrosporum TaxID=76867 RepID=A0A0C3CTJ6_HEBCY|nr:hypothetical protein M413DRAFT_440688 [Hebeloma cylindrosporum h7]